MIGYNDNYDFIILSDLHISSRSRSLIGKFARNEDFIYDEAFERLLNYFHNRAIEEKRTWRLILLGDTLDFLRVEPDESIDRNSRANSSKEISLKKLSKIDVSHPIFFKALGEFATKGHLIVIVPGNHDIDFMRASTQAYFRELIVAKSDRPEIADRIQFYPWIYYVPGVLYAEHGQQYHDINSFSTLLRPHDPHRPEQLELPLGSSFELYLSCLVEALDPLATNINPLPRNVLRTLWARPLVVLKTWREHLRFLRVITLHLWNLWSSETRNMRKAYREQVLREQTDRLGLSYQTIVAIDRLAGDTAMALPRRVLLMMQASPIGRVLPIVAFLLALFAILRRHRLAGLVFLSLSFLGLRHTVGAPGKLIRSPEYLHRAAAAIHTLLQAEQADVPFYLFGHTHIAECASLMASTGRPYYINSGSWLQNGAPSGAPTQPPPPLPFVEITRDMATGRPAARLLFWNDDAGRPTSLR